MANSSGASPKSDAWDCMSQPSSPPHETANWSTGRPKKRKAHTMSNPGSDEEDLEDDREDHSNPDPDPDHPETATSVAPTTPGATIRNMVAFTKRYATKKKLKTEHATELETFIQDSALGRQVKLFANLLSLESKLEKIVTTSATDWSVSKGLQSNIDSYGIAVLGSKSIFSYKGDIPTNIVLEILKKHPYDMPTDIMQYAAQWKKLVSAVQTSLSQRRGTWKKMIEVSIEKKQNIYDLTKKLVKKTGCKVTGNLCGRVALMRKVHGDDDTVTYWDSVDKELEKVRKRAENGANGDEAEKRKRLRKGFEGLLKKDKAEFGNCIAGEKDADEGQESDLQNLVDDHIAATVAAASPNISTSNANASTSNVGASGASGSAA